jgi:hypothetical protein
MATKKARTAGVGHDRDFCGMADAVRTYYILEHRRHVESRQGGGPCTYGCRPLPRWDGGTDADGRSYGKPVWFEIVRYALAHAISPILLVRGTFRAWNSPTPPRPNQFTNALSLQRARLLAEQPAVLGANLKMEDHRFKAATMIHQVYDKMDVEAAARRALHDPTTDLSPLYRYCVGTLGGADDVADRFRQQAFQIYVFDRDAYDAAWADRIPRELREAADHFYGEVLPCL